MVVDVVVEVVVLVVDEVVVELEVDVEVEVPVFDSITRTSPAPGPDTILTIFP